jgi:hypothetical protein
MLMNLTHTAQFIKKFSKYLLLIVVGYYLITLVLFPGSVSLFRAIFIKKVPPNPVYGQLDQLQFVKKRILNENPEYVLNTTNAKLPGNLPDKMNVYKFKPQQYSYLAGNNAISEAETLGFTNENLISDLKGTEYKWRNSQHNSTLKININTRAIELKTNMNGKSSYYSPRYLNTPESINIASKKLSSIYRFDDELYPSGSQVVTFGYYVNNRLVKTDNELEAQVAMVDFYRYIEKYPILGPNPYKGMLRIAIAKTATSEILNNPLLEANFWQIETTTQATYPIITVQEAWESIKAGKGVIVGVKPNKLNPFEAYIPTSVDKILVDNIYLAYYETPEYQTYLQPIYVFSGKYTSRESGGGDITLYFPAITGQWTKQTPTSE